MLIVFVVLWHTGLTSLFLDVSAHLLLSELQIKIFFTLSNSTSTSARQNVLLSAGLVLVLRMVASFEEGRVRNLIKAVILVFLIIVQTEF